MGTINEFSNDDRQSMLSIVLLAIMSVVTTGLIVMAALSTRACSV